MQALVHGLERVSLQKTRYSTCLQAAAPYQEALMQDVPIIIGGFFRSGTSLVRRLLDSHSRIHCGPEVKFFRDFNGDYKDDSFAHLRLFSTARTFGLPDAELLAIFGNAFISFHERAAALAGKARWADKNPENVLYLENWRTLLPGGFCFIHVIRHPLDALASLKESPFPKTIPAAFSDKAQLYKAYRDAGDIYSDAVPEASITIKYEDLVSTPEHTLQTLFEFLGEPFESDVLDKFHLPERGQGIEDPKVARPRAIHSDSIGSWTSRLSPDEIATATEILKPFLG